MHSTRSPESWYASVMETIFVINGDNPNQPWGIWLAQRLFPFKVGRPMARYVRRALHFGGDYSRANLVRYFKAWEAAVLAEVPKDKLLVFRPADGWGPLCAHLGKPVPDVPFPNVNDSAEFKSKVLVALNVVGWVTAALYGAALAAVARKVLGASR